MLHLVPLFGLAVAVLAVAVDPSSSGNDLLAVVPVAAFGAWAYLRRVPLVLLSIAVVVPVAAAQRSGELEPLMFELSLLAFVVGRWARSFTTSTSLGLLVAGAPVAISLLQDPSEINVGIWILGVAFPWSIGRALAHQAHLAAELDATRRQLSHQALLSERRRIARDVHDFVGHGLAAMMLQITSARHVLRRDPAEAEEALRSAEEVGRRSMLELRRTVLLLRGDDEQGVDSQGAMAPLPTAAEIPSLVDQARTGGLAAELRVHGDLARIPPGVGVALYRIAQEALANAAHHAPTARTALEITMTDGRVRFVADTNGSAVAGKGTEPDRPRYGLIGMRERATALGGELSAGPTRDGWRVSCELPLEPPGDGSAEAESSR